MYDCIPSGNGINKQNIQRVYDFMAGIYDRLGYHIDRNRFCHISEHLDLKPGHKLLDVGTGPGIVPFALRDLGHQNEIVGIDFSRRSIDRAIGRQYRTSQNHMRFIVADMECIPLPDATFDRLTCADSLLLVRDKAGVMKEFRRVLKNGGKGVIVEPTPGGLKKRVSYLGLSAALRLCSMVNSNLKGVSATDYHGKSYMTSTEIYQLVVGAGMCVREVIEMDTHTYCLFERTG